MKDDHAPAHEYDHAEPTVIHHPEEDLTALARWLRHAMERGAQFWVLVGLAVLVLGAVAFISSGLVAGSSSDSEAWSELTTAKTVEDHLKIAEAHPGTPVSGWAKLQAAKEEFDTGVNDLTAPGRKELAGPRLAKALKLFQEVAKEAKNTSQAVGGLFGAARTLEARNELDEAIAEYKKVVEKFPDTPSARQSRAMIKALGEPANRLFYKELYTYAPKPTLSSTPPPESQLPGSGGIGGPGSIFTPPTDFRLPTSPSTPSNNAAPAGLDAPPPTSPTTPPPTLEPPKAEESKKVEAPKPAEAPKTEAPKAEPPADPTKPPK